LNSGDIGVGEKPNIYPIVYSIQAKTTLWVRKVALEGHLIEYEKYFGYILF
jgi:hypothetical protein